MVIDKIGGVGPSYGPGKKSEPVGKKAEAAIAKDNVTISAEAARAADVAKVARAATTAQDPARTEKLKEVREKRERGDYDNLTDEQLGTIADKIGQSFFG